MAMKTYRGDCLREIIFPLGGIGAGSIGLCGNGALQDFEIFNRPAKGSFNGYTFLAVRAEDGDKILDARTLTGVHRGSGMGAYDRGQFHGYGYGPRCESMAGFPYFAEQSFKGEFPFATLRFRDPHFPARIKETAFSPFIPTDDKDSSLPVAMFEIEFENTADRPLTYTAAFSVKNPYAKTQNARTLRASMKAITLSHATAKRDTPEYGDMTVATSAPDSFAQTYWYRGHWMDGIATFWGEFSKKKKLEDRAYAEPAAGDGCSVLASVTLAPGERGRVRFVLAWNNPIASNYWSGAEKPYTWRNYYATQFKNSLSTASYVLRKWASLARRSRAFTKAMLGMTAPDVVKDAALNTLTVLKSPTTLRMTDGTFWAWEGVHEESGSCEGTCTHVWSYAYAMCFLFPALERSLRETEYKYDMDKIGAVRFRTPIPFDTPLPDDIRPCLDGQMGGVIKTYREWKLSGNDEWLRAIYPGVKLSLDFARHPDSPWKWDANGDGVLEGSQHHTLDMELFGPSSWLEGMYIAALEAGAAMADAMGDPDAALYRRLAAQGREFTEKHLFNGKYYIQKIDLDDLDAIKDFPDVAPYRNEERGEVKYQIGEGSSVDQMLGEWHAHLCGLPSVFDAEHKKTALASLYKNNYFASLADEPNPWRIFAYGEEAGTCICVYPEGVRKPIIPPPYTEECMHGFEYSAAGLMLAEGFESEALDMIRGVRDRYDGKKRNPYNEMECGSNYARSMAAFALVPILSGYTFDMPNGYIGFAPKTRDEKGSFSTVFGAADAFGSMTTTPKKTEISMLEGSLTLRAFGLPESGCVAKVLCDGVEIPFTQNEGKACFDATFRKLEIIYS